MELTAAQLQIRCSTLRLICSCAAARARVHPPCPLSPPDWRCCAARARRPRASAAPPPPPRRAAPARPSGAPSAPRGRSSALASARIAPAPPARWRAPWHGRSLPWHGRSSCAADRRLRQRPCPSGRLSVGTCVHAWGRGATVALFAPGRSRSADRPAPPRADQRAGEPPRPSPPMARSPHDTGRGGRTEPARPSRGAHRPLAGSRPAQPSPISRHHFGRSVRSGVAAFLAPPARPCLCRAAAAPLVGRWVGDMSWRVARCSPRQGGGAGRTDRRWLRCFVGSRRAVAGRPHGGAGGRQGGGRRRGRARRPQLQLEAAKEALQRRVGAAEAAACSALTVARDSAASRARATEQVRVAGARQPLRRAGGEHAGPVRRLL